MFMKLLEALGNLLNFSTKQGYKRYRPRKRKSWYEYDNWYDRQPGRPSDSEPRTKLGENNRD